jgi:hypothetical protein
MANWLARRCDNAEQTYIVDLGDLRGEAGMVISAITGDEGSLLCVSLIEERIDVDTAELRYSSGPYTDCLSCFNDIDPDLSFISCFKETDFDVLASSLRLEAVPQIGKVYKVDVTIPASEKRGKETVIKGCFTYEGYSDRATRAGIVSNAPIVEFDTCGSCNPYRSNLPKWSERVSKSESFTNLRDNYIRIISGSTGPTGTFPSPDIEAGINPKQPSN